MQPTFIIAGKINREYILPSSGKPILDSPSGSLLYAAGGLAVWDANVGLIGRVSEDFPRQWRRDLEARGFDTSGIRALRELQDVDVRTFTAFTDSNELSHSNPVSHFARRQLTFPKSLLGYQPSSDEARKDPLEPDPASPAALDVQKEYRDVGYVHLCPFDLISQSQMVNLFRGGQSQTVSLDPSPGYMSPAFWRNLRLVLQGVTIFQPSEQELRALFWGETTDLWEMARKVSEYGPQIIVIKRGSQGQMVYDVPGNHRYEIPAYPARVVDPTGAGDAFCGGFLAGFQKTNDPLTAALYGNVSASLKIEGSGPFYELSVLPGLAEARLHSLKETVRKV